MAVIRGMKNVIGRTVLFVIASSGIMIYLISTNVIINPMEFSKTALESYRKSLVLNLDQHLTQIEANKLGKSNRTLPGTFLKSTSLTTIKPMIQTTRNDNINKLNQAFLNSFKRDCEAYKIADIMKSDKPYCPCVSHKLVGQLTPAIDEPSWQELEAAHPEVDTGGHWAPTACAARQRACLIVPYRDREGHLKIWLKNIIPFLQKQDTDFNIFIVEQNNGSRFNRGMLINIAFVQAFKLGVQCECIIVHDVDAIPEDDQTMYFCVDNPIHLAVARRKDRYKLPYGSFIGTAMAVLSSHFKSHNGFSNLYFGWGSEDDDVYERLTKVLKKPVRRYPASIARYYNIQHEGAVENQGRWKLVRSWRSRWSKDGLNNVMERCSIEKIEKKKLFTHIFASFDEKSVKAGTGYE